MKVKREKIWIPGPGITLAELLGLREDKERLDWLSRKGTWHAFGDSVGLLFLPERLENGQTVRAAIDAARSAERRAKGKR